MYTRNIRIIFNLFIVPSDYQRWRGRAATFAPETHPTAVTLTPRRNLKVIEYIWGLKIPRKRTCEHPRPLDRAAYIFTDQESKVVSRTCGASPQFTFIPLISLAYRNHTAGRPKSSVYAEVIYRRCGERSTTERQSHLDTSTTPVCPLLSKYAH